MLSKRMSIEELGGEYEKHALLQQYFIDECKKRIEKAKRSGDMNAVSELKAQLNKFYEIKKELEETALKLKNYYKNKGEN